MENQNISTKPNLWKRMFAGLIDYTFMFGILYTLCLYFGEPTEDGGYTLNGLPGLSMIIIWFIYMIGFELKCGGTLGNLIFDLKVVSIKSNNAQISFGQSFKRHFVDMIDIWPFGLFGIILIKNTKYNQRLGDLWAKTIVIDTKDSEQFYKRFA